VKPSTSPSPTASPSPIPVSTPEPRNEPATEPVWSLVNLVLGVVGLLLAVVMFFVSIFALQRKQDNSQNNPAGGSTNKPQYRTLLLVTALIMGIVGVVVFLLTEDMSRTMGWVDNWSIVNAIIFVIEIIAISLSFKFKNNP
jgi:uncharacterized membrane protein